MNGVYSPVFVMLSIVIAVLASYTALRVTPSVAAARGRVRLAWLTGGALAMGVGIWSMHFIGMLAFEMPSIPIAYDVPLLVLSAVAAVLASALALYVVSRRRAGLPSLLLAALAMGIAIAGMHYIGMWGMRMPARVEWNFVLVAASILIAVGAVFAALWLAFRYRHDASDRAEWIRVGGGVLMGLAIAGMHYTAMAAALFVPTAGPFSLAEDHLLGTDGLGTAVVLTTLVILAVALLATAIDRQLRGREMEILESISDAFMAFDPEWRFIYVNARAAELLSKSREELIGQSVWETFPQAIGSRFHEEYQRAMAEGVPAHFEARSVVSDRWMEAHAYPGHGMLAVYLRDVTERKHTEERLRESEERFRELAESMREVFWAFTADFSSTLYINPAYTSVFGLPREDLYENPTAFLEVVHPDDRPALLEAMGKLAQAPQDVVFRINRPDGSLRFLHARGSPVRNAQGEVSRINGLTEDVTERELAEEALRRREEQLLEAQRLADLGSWEWDIGEDHVTWSDNLYRIWGMQPGESPATLEAHLERVHPDDRQGARAVVEQALETGREFDFEERIIRPDGSIRVLQSRGEVIRDAAGRPSRMVGTCQDITERKRMEDALRAAKEEAEAASRAKSEMLSRTSHELRTPLNAILGFGQLLEMEVEGEENQESVEQIVRAGRHLLGLIDDVLDIARADSGQMTLPSEPVHVGETVEEVLSLVRPLATQNGVELPPSPLESCDVRVDADPQRFKQVLHSLISNAIKYNREGGRVEVACEEAEETHVRIAVRDTGPGISGEKLSRLFTPFERVGAEQTGIGGAGLGLALSKALTQAMGGEIGARSIPGDGSVFWIEMPRSLEESSVNKPVVLYVEDEPANVRLVERIFNRSRPDVELITADTGRKGLELASERRPDLVLLDLHLPDLSGEDVLRALREDARTRRIPVMMLSGDVVPDQIERLRELGAVEYLTKPFQVPHFLGAVDSVLEPTD